MEEYQITRVLDDAGGVIVFLRVQLFFVRITNSVDEVAEKTVLGADPLLPRVNDGLRQAALGVVIHS